MVKKQFIKRSEARILLYLDQVANPLKYVAKISRRLDIDYNYCNRVLLIMKEKKWVFTHRLVNKTFYDLTSQAPIEPAKAVLQADDFLVLESATRQSSLDFAGVALDDTDKKDKEVDKDGN